ncbi:MAG: hypothetical protein ACAH17_00015 [Candidatus Paceibacterota bacterium]
MNEAFNNNTSVPEQEKTRPYSVIRTLFFILSILFFIAVLVFLVYYNGKSIYANGL